MLETIFSNIEEIQHTTVFATACHSRTIRLQIFISFRNQLFYSSILPWNFKRLTMCSCLVEIYFLFLYFKNWQSNYKIIMNNFIFDWIDLNIHTIKKYFYAIVCIRCHSTFCDWVVHAQYVEIGSTRTRTTEAMK